MIKKVISTPESIFTVFPVMGLIEISLIDNASFPGAVDSSHALLNAS
jgi:hypothetical protein